MSFSMNIPLLKADESLHEVWGRATQEIIDHAGEIMDYETSKPLFQAWSDDFAKRTNGKSYGAIREQHDSKKAVGKIVEPLSFSDSDKAIDIHVKVVDENTWRKVSESVLTAFSIGGAYEKTWTDEEGNFRYTARPTEISLVDEPCCSAAVIQFVKADGTIEEKPLKKEVSNVDKEKETQVEAVEKAVETETVEKTAVEIEPKDEPKPEVEKTSVEVDSKQEEEVKDEIKDDDKDDDCDCDKECKKRDFTAEERKKLAEEGKAMPDGSFPIENKEDLKNAIRLVGQAKDKEKAMAFIKKRAKALNAEDMIPESWGKAEKADEPEMTKADDMKKEDVFEMVCKAMENADDENVKKGCSKVFHKIVEMGLACKCDKCAKAVESATAEKAAADTGLHKAASNESEAMQKFAPADELAKAMGVIDELKKGFDALKSDNEALKKQVEKLENEPVAGGAIMANGTMALDKTIGGSMGNAPANNGEADMLKKMIAETDSAVLKEAYSKQLAQLEMKKVFG